MVHADKDDMPEAAVARLQKLIDEVTQEQTAANRQASKGKFRWWLALLGLIACAGALYTLYHFGLLRVE